MIWYLPNLLVILFISWWLKPQMKLRKVYWAALFLKMLAGIALGYIYFAEIGGGDTISFHHQASMLYQLFSQSFAAYLEYLFTVHHPAYLSEARNELFVKIISLFYIISGGDYWICSLYLSLVSFLGAWYFVKTVHMFYPSLLPAAAIGFLFLPSAVFWSSGVLKDPLINATMFFLAGIAVRYYKNSTFRWWEIFFSFISLLLLFYLRYYLLAVALLVLGCLIWSKILAFMPSKVWLQITVTVIVIGGMIFLSSLLHWNLNFSHLPGAIHTNYSIIYENSDKENALDFTSLKPTWKSLLIHLPNSLFAGLFRPFPGEGSVSNIVHGAENILLVLLAVGNLYFIRSIKINLAGWLAIGYIIILASFLPLASPNFGSLIRYKAAYLPFLFFLFSIVPWQKYFRKTSKNLAQIR